MKKKYIQWDENEGYIRSIIRKIALDNWVPDIVVGITRGGLLPAVMISNYFNKPMVALGVSLRDNSLGIGQETNCWLPEMANEGKKILIVDDINDTGATINWIHKDWYIKDPSMWVTSIRFAVLFDKTSSKAEITPAYSAVEISAEDDKQWMVFPWEYE